MDYSQVILVFWGRQVADKITLSGEYCEIRYAGNGVFANYWIDLSAFPFEEESALPGE
jgi:hypothetical protein